MWSKDIIVPILQMRNVTCCVTPNDKNNGSLSQHREKHLPVSWPGEPLWRSGNLQQSRLVELECKFQESMDCNCPMHNWITSTETMNTQQMQNEGINERIHEWTAAEVWLSGRCGLLQTRAQPALSDQDVMGQGLALWRALDHTVWTPPSEVRIGGWGIHLLLSANIYLTPTVGQVLAWIPVNFLAWFRASHSFPGPLASAWLPPTGPVHSSLQPGEAEWIRLLHQGSLSWWVDTSTLPFSPPTHRDLEMGSVSGRKQRWSLSVFPTEARREAKEHEELEAMLQFQTSPSGTEAWEGNRLS